MTATFIRADVRREHEVAAFVDACVRRHGRIDVAFNNAGVETPRPAPLHEQSLETFQDVWQTNAAGVFLAMKYELPYMLRPDEIARVVMWLASDEATPVVGTDEHRRLRRIPHRLTAHSSG